MAAKDRTVERTREQMASSAGRAITRLGKHVERAVAPTGVSVPQYRILCGLAEGISGSTKLAAALAVRPASITEIIDGLVARGWVLRSPDPNDGRRTPLELTGDGFDALVRADAAINDRLAEIADYLETPIGEVLGFLESWHRALDDYHEEHGNG